MPSSHKNSNLTLIHVLRVIVKWLSVAKQDTGMSEQQQRWFTPENVVSIAAKLWNNSSQ